MFFDYDINTTVMVKYLPELCWGLRNTALVSAVGMAFALVVAVFTALARLSRSRLLSKAAAAYVESIRATPLLVQVYFLFFGLPELGVLLPAFTVGVIALALNSGAYGAEIIRAGIEHIHKTQYEAADSLALSYAQKMRYVILPQAFRNIFPPLVGQASYLVKDSALVSVMGVVELTKAANTVQAETFRPLEAFLPAMAMYLVLILSLIYGASFLERRLRRW